MGVVFFFFFFQAEDGIRDVERSRGLGDVYKRQVHGVIQRFYYIGGVGKKGYGFFANQDGKIIYTPQDMENSIPDIKFTKDSDTILIDGFKDESGYSKEGLVYYKKTKYLSLIHI
eukprot:TRINITY_DN38229_c0_g1_i1.p3 TRINITY_DN38229_c0_g1~~TRINITY_DN38229_c0_g1_i1.p3  ORF type:complete len:115 (+),score=37.49 TRINITY_DN38229_c0_g1_i1:63-407(+)